MHQTAGFCKQLQIQWNRSLQCPYQDKYVDFFFIWSWFSSVEGKPRETCCFFAIEQMFLRWTHCLLVPRHVSWFCLDFKVISSGVRVSPHVGTNGHAYGVVAGRGSRQNPHPLHPLSATKPKKQPTPASCEPTFGKKTFGAAHLTCTPTVGALFRFWS